MKPFAVLDTNLEDAEEVQAFCYLEALPPVVVFDEVNVTKMFGEVVKTQLVYVVDPAADNSQALAAFSESALYNIQHDPKSERTLHVVYYVDEIDEGMKWFFNIKDTKNLPQLFLTETAIELDKILKFQYQKVKKIFLA